MGQLNTISLDSTQSLMAMHGYELFEGDDGEDVERLLRIVELIAFSNNKDEDAYKLRMVSLLLDG